MTISPSPLTADERAELERLRVRIAELDAELAEQARRINALVAATQTRVYWLDRWNLDLNALMAKPGAAEFRWIVRALRQVVRVVRRAKRKILG
jgi:uncharacterized coiled-coil protein SlyX